MWKSTVELGYLRHPETTSRRFDFHTGAEATKGGGGAGICAKDLAEQDVVLMNFETLENDLGQEKFASPLLHVQWWRMMTDEAQMFKTVWKSKFYGAFVLNRRVDLHATTRRLLDSVAMPVTRRSTEPGRPRHRREMTE